MTNAQAAQIPFSGGQDLTGKYAVAHKVLLANETFGGKGAYVISLAPAKSGYSFGGVQWDLLGDVEIRPFFTPKDLLSQILREGASPLPESEITEIRRVVTTPGERLTPAQITSINRNTASPRGIDLINNEHAPYIHKIVDRLEQQIIDTAKPEWRSTLRTDGRFGSLINYDNQYPNGIEVNGPVHRYLQGLEVQVGGGAVPMVSVKVEGNEFGWDDWMRIATNTKYARETYRGRGDIFRRENNVLKIVGTQGVVLTPEERAGIRKMLSDPTVAPFLSSPANTAIRDLLHLTGFRFIRTKSERLRELRSEFLGSQQAASPIVIDVDGDGIETTAVVTGPHFDHDGDGFAEQTGWAASDDGLLVWDRNGDGEINGGGELFGDQTLLENGQRASSGFHALADLDDNSDGKLDATDAVWGSLRVWHDFDGDGVAAAAELLAPGDDDIAAIATAATPSGAIDANGNEHRLVGTAIRGDGTTTATADVWFRTDRMLTADLAYGTVPEDILALPDVVGSGIVPDLSQAMARDSSGLLKTLVTAFVGEADPGQRTVILTELVLRWTGSSEIDPASRGAFIDARELAVIERVFGQGYSDGGESNPHHVSGPILRGLYDAVAELVYTELMAQSHLRDVWDLVTFDGTAPLQPDLEAVSGELEQRLIADPIAGRATLGEFARTLRSVVPIASSTYLEFRERFAFDPDLAWAMDSAGKTIIVEGPPGTEPSAWRGGVGNDYFFGGIDADALHGGEGQDELHGYLGNDIIDGGPGLDSLYGEAGDDILIGDYFLDGGPGNDVLIGGPGDDWELLGGEGNDILDGRGGQDYTLDGGPGADIYIFGRGYGFAYIRDEYGTAGGDAIAMRPEVTPEDVVVHGYNGGYNDEVSISITGTTDEIRFLMSPVSPVPEIRFANGVTLDEAAVRAAAVLPSDYADVLRGTPGDDAIFALGGDDSVSGDSGNDILDGGAGNDGLHGDYGDDLLYGQAGDDYLSGSYGNDALYGGAGNDVLDGYAGQDVLDGGPGADVMRGGSESDVYVVDDVGDTITEVAALNVDTVQASVSYTLPLNVENLILTGTAAINGTGNDLANDLTGNSGPNTLDGGALSDTMRGGAGDDVYVVSQSGDIVIELPGEGDDTVRATVSKVLAADVERLELLGTGSIDATGNALDNTLTGNPGSNTLDGKAGADTMIGGAGNDTYVIDTLADTVVEVAGGGTDTVQSSLSYALPGEVEKLTLTGTAAINATGNALNNTLTGNSGNNVLDGQGGADSMAGGSGADTYIVDHTGDTVTENSGGGTDLVQSSVTFTLANNVEQLTLTGTANINATGNTLNNTLIGNSGNNKLDGKTGADSMTGAGGDDTYVVDHTGDGVFEAVGGGVDLVQSSVTYTLPVEVERLTLTGTAAINGTGNTLDNILTGNSGDNTLDGRAGADAMTGSGGNDTYVVDHAGDTVTESASGGMDLVKSSVTYTLGNNVEDLTLTGSTVINGTGNTLANTLTGNSAANTLTGKAGNDTYVVGASDTVVELANEGVDTVLASGTFTLSANVENLTLTSGGNFSGTGNAGANVLRGNTGANTLTGGAGNDTYLFGTGSGQDKIVDDDATVGTLDQVQFDAPLRPLDVVIQQSANDLLLKLYGTTDALTIRDWYLGASHQTEEIHSGDGNVLVNTQVAQLIQAMSDWSSGSGLTWEGGIQQRPDEVQAILTAHWQPG